jgi:hypothetical protein
MAKDYERIYLEAIEARRSRTTWRVRGAPGELPLELDEAANDVGE